MKPKHKRIVLAALVLIGVVCVWMINYPLLRFSSTIADADRVELSFYLDKNTPVIVTLTNEQAKAIVACVSDSVRDSTHYAAKFSFTARFYHETNFSGSIDFCGNLFLVDGKQYRNPSGQFRQLAVKPLMDAYSVKCLEPTIDVTNKSLTPTNR